MLPARDPVLRTAGGLAEEFVLVPGAGAAHSEPFEDPHRGCVRRRRLRPDLFEPQLGESVAEPRSGDSRAEPLPPPRARSDRVAQLPLGRIGAVEVRVADDLALERRHEAHQLTRRRDRHAVPELVHRRALEIGAPAGVLDEDRVRRPSGDGPGVVGMQGTQADHRAARHRHSLAGGSVMGMSEEQTSGALAPTRRQALARPDFPVARVARRLGVDPAQAEIVLHDGEKARAAIARSVEEFLAADDERRAGRAPSTALALDPDFPTGVGMALVGAAVLWGARDLVPLVARRVARDHYEDGADALAACSVALMQEAIDPGEDSAADALAGAAQSLLVSVLQRSGSAVQADEIARDLAAHYI